MFKKILNFYYFCHIKLLTKNKIKNFNYSTEEFDHFELKLAFYEYINLQYYFNTSSVNSK